ncbi:fanconi-associated nuclease 1 [Dorcoceras hygrometricum]|uniref:Fanconi-associated nuclease n=1 Tax=Dorcoceras hygrometricum TaxID=472368 RepID=A0A2Z7BIN6_9LAMI|nr:fanconi-associated nuclease 1 [Dorcoceras hygrometricum]
MKAARWESKLEADWDVGERLRIEFRENMKKLREDTNAVRAILVTLNKSVGDLVESTTLVARLIRSMKKEPSERQGDRGGVDEVTATDIVAAVDEVTADEGEIGDGTHTTDRDKVGRIQAHESNRQAQQLHRQAVGSCTTKGRYSGGVYRVAANLASKARVARSSSQQSGVRVGWIGTPMYHCLRIAHRNMEGPGIEEKEEYVWAFSLSCLRYFVCDKGKIRSRLKVNDYSADLDAPISIWLLCGPLKSKNSHVRWGILFVLERLLIRCKILLDESEVQHVVRDDSASPIHDKSRLEKANTMIDIMSGALSLMTQINETDRMNILKKRSQGARKRDMIDLLPSSCKGGLCTRLQSFVLARTDACVRISPWAESLIWRIERLFFRNGEQDLSTFLLVDLGIVKYPVYNCIISEQIFSNRSDLLSFEESVEVAQIMVEAIDDCNGEFVLRCIEISVSNLKASSEEGKYSTEKSMASLLSRFSTSWTYSKVVLLGVSFLEHEKRRGYWVLRLSVNLEQLGCILKVCDILFSQLCLKVVHMSLGGVKNTKDSSDSDGKKKAKGAEHFSRNEKLGQDDIIGDTNSKRGECGHIIWATLTGHQGHNVAEVMNLIGDIKGKVVVTRVANATNEVLEQVANTTNEVTRDGTTCAAVPTKQPCPKAAFNRGSIVREFEQENIDRPKPLITNVYSRRPKAQGPKEETSYRINRKGSEGEGQPI